MKFCLVLVGCATSCKLAARLEDIAPTRTPNVRLNAFRFKYPAKAIDAFRRRRPIRQRLGRIVWYQIHLSSKFVTIQKIRELARVLVCIVYPIKQDVLESKSLAMLQRCFKFFAGGE